MAEVAGLVVGLAPEAGVTGVATEQVANADRATPEGVAEEEADPQALEAMAPAKSGWEEAPDSEVALVMEVGSTMCTT